MRRHFLGAAVGLTAYGLVAACSGGDANNDPDERSIRVVLENLFGEPLQDDLLVVISIGDDVIAMAASTSGDVTLPFVDGALVTAATRTADGRRFIETYVGATSDVLRVQGFPSAPFQGLPPAQPFAFSLTGLVPGSQFTVNLFACGWPSWTASSTSAQVFASLGSTCVDFPGRWFSARTIGAERRIASIADVAVGVTSLSLALAPETSSPFSMSATSIPSGAETARYLAGESRNRVVIWPTSGTAVIQDGTSSATNDIVQTGIADGFYSSSSWQFGDAYAIEYRFVAAIPVETQIFDFSERPAVPSNVAVTTTASSVDVSWDIALEGSIGFGVVTFRNAANDLVWLVILEGNEHQTVGTHTIRLPALPDPFDEPGLIDSTRITFLENSSLQPSLRYTRPTRMRKAVLGDFSSFEWL